MSALGVNRICRDGGSDVNDPMRHRQVAQKRVSEPTLGPFQSASLRRYDVLS
jgi:hypothetical protein